MSKKRRSHNWRGFTQAAPPRFIITDSHTNLRVQIDNPLRFTQLIRRGIAERLSQTDARLRKSFKLASSDLAENGELKLLALVAADGPSIASNWVSVERAWMYQTDYSPHFEDRQYFTEERQREIEMEALLWGLPESEPLVLSRQME